AQHRAARPGPPTAARYRPRSMRGERWPVAAALAGLAVAVAAAVVLPPPPAPLAGRAAAQAFVDSWSRSRRATFVVTSTFERHLDDGKGLTATTTVVQRPPDRLSYGLGTAEGRIGGKVVRCGSAPDGRYDCITGVAVGDYDAEV